MAESKLTDLIAKLEAATEGSRDLDAEIAVSLSGDPEAWVVNPAPHSIFSPVPGWWRTGNDESHKAPDYTTSLDAIVGLIERKLPGWGGMVSFGSLTCGATLHTADLWGLVTETGETEDGIAIQLRPEEHGENRKPALALCIALLSALQLQGGSEQ